MRAEEVFHAFVAAINLHDVAGLAELMAAEIVFIDSLGNGVSRGPRAGGGRRGARCG